MLARTFLTVVQSGSFVHAAAKLNVTQSTVSLRIKTLEEELGKELFERSKEGARLTAAGEQFEKHALTLVRVWAQAQLEVGLSDEHADHLSVGADVSLWNAFMIPWIGWMGDNLPEIAVSAVMGSSSAMLQQLVDGTLDLAVVYNAEQRAGIVVEHLFDEELVLVTSGEPRGRTPGKDYVFVNWSPEFAADHEAAYPNLDYSGVNLELGAIGIQYLLERKASAYFPLRLVRPLIKRRRLKPVPRARRFVCPVAVAYPEEHDEDAYEPMIEGLREMAEAF
jgi:DNA-binding transcriptional LysR family regulator